MIIRYLDLSGYLQCNYNTVQCNAIQEQYSSSIPIHGMLLHCDIRIYTCVCTEKEHSMHTHRGTLSPKPPNSTDTRLVAAYCAVGVSASFTSVFCVVLETQINFVKPVDIAHEARDAQTTTSDTVLGEE